MNDLTFHVESQLIQRLDVSDFQNDVGRLEEQGADDSVLAGRPVLAGEWLSSTFRAWPRP